VRRLALALRNDVRLQLRQGFYAAAAFVAIIAAAALWYLQETVSSGLWATLLPPLVLSNLIMGTFYFVAGLVLLERSEGTLAALVVTPLRQTEYLASKLLSLYLLGILEHIAIVRIGFGPGFDPWLLTVGIGMATAVYVLVGFMAVSRHHSLNDYLLPSMAWVAILCVPYAQYFVAADSPWKALFWLHPLQPGLLLMHAAFGGPLDPSRLAYVLLYGGACIAIAWHLSLAALRDFVVLRPRTT
jgi:fluoroquinolone transport system permease protein